MSISWGKVTIIHKNPLILGISPCSNLQKPTLLLKLVSKAPQFLAPRNGFGQSFNSFLMAGRGSDMGILTNILLTNKYRETMRNMHQPFHEDLNIWCMNNNFECEMPAGDAQTCCTDSFSQVLFKSVKTVYITICTCKGNPTANNPDLRIWSAQ